MLQKLCKTVSSLLPLGHSPPRQTVRSPLANIGCGGTFHPLWDNFDLVPSAPAVRPLDVAGDTSLPDNCYEAVYSSHVLEHLPRNLAPRTCGEFHRILKKGGIVRLVVPDLESIASNYLLALPAASQGDLQATAKHEWMTMELIDQMTRTFSGGFMGRLWWSRPLPSREFIISRLGEEAGKWLDHIDAEIQKGAKPLDRRDIYQVAKQNEKEIVRFRDQGEIHQWMYDRVSLKRLLEKAGFQSVKVCGPTESSIPDFVSYHLDTNEKGETRKPDSLFMEAIKLG